MKKMVTLLLAFAAFIFSASAQETGKMKHYKHRHGNGILMKGINLSAAQKEQMKTNWHNTKNQLSELNKNEDITVREYKSRKAAIMKIQKEQMDKVLTTEQKNQLVQNKANRKAKHEIMSAKRLDKMKSRLNLSDEQLAKIKANRQASQEKLQAIRGNSQLSPMEKREQSIALMKGQKVSFKELLTPEQINKMEQMKKDRMDKKGSK